MRKKTKPCLHLSLGKVGPFTFESHIHVKALTCKVFQIIRCLIKPLSKKSIQTIFQGGTSWAAHILNHIIVWMVLYCAHQLLGVKKKTFLHLSLGKVGSFTSESHIHVKALKRKVFQIMRCVIKLPLSKKQHPNYFSRWYLMSGSNTQSYDCLDGTLLCTPTFGSEKKNKTLSPPFFG